MKKTNWDSMSNKEVTSETWADQLKKRYFFCYSDKLTFFLMNVKRLKSVTTAYTEDGRKFTLFERSDRVNNALDEYNELLSKKQGYIRWEELKAMR